MQIRCYRCGWSFAVKKDEAAFALQALEETGGTHYDSSCPRCRHSNRISLEQLRKAAPRAADERGSSEPQKTEGDGAGGPDPESEEPSPEMKDPLAEADAVAEESEPEALEQAPEMNDPLTEADVGGETEAEE